MVAGATNYKQVLGNRLVFVLAFSSDSHKPNLSYHLLVQNRIHVVKNSRNGGNRPLVEYQEDLEVALVSFERNNGIELPPLVRRTLGARGHNLNSKRDRSYTHPFPFLNGYDGFLFGCLAVPADIDDGLADFTNLYLLASQTDLVVIFNDPSWVYNPFFGGAVIKLVERDARDGVVSPPDLVLEILGFTVASLDHALEALSNRRDHYAKKIKLIDKDNGPEIESEVERRFPAVENLQIETSSLTTVVEEVSRVLTAVAAGQITFTAGGVRQDFFQFVEVAARDGLQLHSAHLVAYLRSLLFDIEALIHRLDRYQERALTIATHRITALGALLLFPSLVYGYFGQAFGELPQWWYEKGFQVTLIGTVTYWIAHFTWFKRKKYI